MLDVLRRFTNIHKVGDFHCYEDNGRSCFVFTARLLCVRAVRAVLSLTHSLWPLFGGMAMLEIKVSESNQKTAFCILCSAELSWWWWWRRRFYLISMAIHFNPKQIQSNGMRFGGRSPQQQQKTHLRVVFQVNHRARALQQTYSEKFAIISMVFCDFLITSGRFICSKERVRLRAVRAFVEEGRR